MALPGFTRLLLRLFVLALTAAIAGCGQSTAVDSGGVSDPVTTDPVTTDPVANDSSDNNGGQESVLPDGDFRPDGFSRMVFHDEFDGTALDRSRWCTRMPWGGGPVLTIPDDYCEKWLGNGYGDYANITEHQRFRDFDSSGRALHEPGDGFIRLLSTNVSGHWYNQYEAASLRSKFEFRPDTSTSYYLTARVRLPDVRGTWPAFFLIPSLEPAGRNQWPPEIDIFEGPLNGNPGTDINSVTQHAQVWGQQTDSQRSEWTFLSPGFNSDHGYLLAGRNLRNQWLEIGAQWTERDVCYFVDGAKTACENYRWVDNAGQQGNPAAIIAYLAVGGPWAGANGIDDTAFPTSLDIDHIRLYAGDGVLSGAPAGSDVVLSAARPDTSPADARPEVSEPAPALDYAPLGYALYQADEFNGDALDRSRWCTRLVYGGGAPLEVPDDECVQNGQGTADRVQADDAQRFRDIDSNGQPLHVVSNGTLKLRASVSTEGGDSSFVAAAIRSKLTLPSAAGYHYFITARVRLPDVRGTWPAMALFPSASASGAVQWPPQVSVFDGPLNASALPGNSLIQKTVLSGPQTVSGEHEWNYVGPGYDVRDNVFRASTSLRGRWLELGIEWTKGHVCWFINGVPNGCENYEWLANDGTLANPASLVAYLAVGGGLAGADGIDSAALPAALEIDWIRIYRRAGF